MGERYYLKVRHFTKDVQVIDLKEAQIDILEVRNVIALQLMLADDHITRQWILTRLILGPSRILITLDRKMMLVGSTHVRRGGSLPFAAARDHLHLDRLAAQLFCLLQLVAVIATQPDLLHFFFVNFKF